MSWPSGSRSRSGSSNAVGAGSKITQSASSSAGFGGDQLQQKPRLVEVKSKFDGEFRRFSVEYPPVQTMEQFRELVMLMHNLDNIPFTLCYTDHTGDVLPITNDEVSEKCHFLSPTSLVDQHFRTTAFLFQNFKKSFESARPVLRLLLRRKGESWEEKYGFGTSTIDRKRRGLSAFLGGGAANLLQYSSPANTKLLQRRADISMPEDFRQVRIIYQWCFSSCRFV